MNLVAIIILILALIYFLNDRSKIFLHMMQLEGYEGEQYIRWLKRSKKAYTNKLKKSSLYILIMTILFVVMTIVFSQYQVVETILWYSYSVLWVFYMLLALEYKNREIKKPLVFTNRAKRLYTTNLILNLFILFLIFVIYTKTGENRLYYFPIILFLGTILYYFQSLTIYLSNIIIKPVEDRINMYYYRKAQEKVNSMEKLIVVGITGSFGKTSTKFITGTILKERFRVLNTPESYNTPMGLSKVINEKLTDKHQVFIAEMGARYLGDIRELAKLTKPTIGVITSIGPTHLETFKNLDNIMKTKYEL